MSEDAGRDPLTSHAAALRSAAAQARMTSYTLTWTAWSTPWAFRMPINWSLRRTALVMEGPLPSSVGTIPMACKYLVKSLIVDDLARIALTLPAIVGAFM